MRRAAVLALALLAAGCGGGQQATRTRIVLVPCLAAKWGYAVCGYPQDQHRASTLWYTFGARPLRVAGPAETVKGNPHPDGFWVAERIFLSPDHTTLLAQWSGECEVQSTYFIPAQGGKPRPIAGGAESTALGWSADGRARIRFPAAACGAGIHVPGIYLLDPQTQKKTLVRRLPTRLGP